MSSKSFRLLFVLLVDLLMNPSALDTLFIACFKWWSGLFSLRRLGSFYSTAHCLSKSKPAAVFALWEPWASWGGHRRGAPFGPLQLCQQTTFVNNK